MKKRLSAGFSVILTAAMLSGLAAPAAYAKDPHPAGDAGGIAIIAEKLSLPEMLSEHGNALSRFALDLGKVRAMRLYEFIINFPSPEPFVSEGPSGSAEDPAAGSEEGSAEFKEPGVPLSDFSGYEDPLRQLSLRVIELINIERAKAGLAPVREKEALRYASDVRASELQTLFSHNRPDGSSCFTVLDEFDAVVYPCAENIGSGQKTAERIVEAWMNSKGHRDNILNPDLKAVGAGVSKELSGRLHWELMLTG